MSHRVRSRLAVVVPAVTALLIGAGGPARAVAHGTAVPDGKYGFAVKLSNYGIPVAGGGKRDCSCSGGLVSPHWVLTAGHCFKNSHGAHVSRTVAHRTTATVGRTDLTGSDGHVANVVAVRQNLVADVALARLDRAVTDVRPLRIATVRPRVGGIVRLTGFGRMR